MSESGTHVIGKGIEAEPVDVVVAPFLEDMVKRWEAGERPSAIDYLAAHPELENHADAGLRLIYEEICLRHEHGEELIKADLLARFPRWSKELEALVDCHLLLADCTVDTTIPETPTDIAHYLIAAELGRGALGHVYLARQIALDHRPVVLKVSQCTGDEHLTLARLQHTNIVPLYSVEEDALRNQRILCMPFFGGATLKEILSILASVPIQQRKGSDLVAALDQVQDALPIHLPADGPIRQFLLGTSYEKAIAWIGSSLADALHFAHERGCVHLDIKPANLLIAADGQPMLLDFHIAQPPLSAGTIAPATFGGTPAYMSPEHHAAAKACNVHGRLSTDLDGRCDIYSLGLVLLEALGGELPKSTNVTPHLAVLPVSIGLRDILARCLAVHPRDRYRSAATLAEDLRCQLHDLPLKEAPNRSLVERWQKWRRRRPAGLSLAVMFGAVLFAAGSLTLVSLRQSDQLQQEAETALTNGAKLLRERRHAEAITALQHGIELSKIRGSDRLQLALKDELDKARRAQLAGKLHELADRFRQYGSDPNLVGDGKILENGWAAVWNQRAWLASSPANGLSAAEHEQVKTDYLDLALIWSELQVRLASKDDKSAAEQRSLTLLEEAETSFGASPAMLLLRQQFAARPEEAHPFDYGKPKSAWEHYALGRALLNQGQLEPAEKLLTRAVELDPRGYWPNYYLGRCALGRGDDAEADSIFRVCIALAPEKAAGHYHRGLALFRLKRSQQALVSFSRALQLDPTLGAAAYHRGLLHVEAKRFKEALSDFEVALSCGHEPALVHYQLAELHTAQGNPTAALAAARLALQLNPSSQQARELLRRIQTP